jgi:hypothetical protein
MFLLSLFSGSLFVLPIAVTVGSYMGIESQKVIDVINGKPPPNVNPDGSQRIVGTTQYCQKAYGFDPYPYRYMCKFFSLSFPECPQHIYAISKLENWVCLNFIWFKQFPTPLVPRAYRLEPLDERDHRSRILRPGRLRPAAILSRATALGHDWTNPV